jgi:hypothetical protein
MTVSKTKCTAYYFGDPASVQGCVVGAWKMLGIRRELGMRLVPGFINSIYCASIAQLWWRRMDPLLPLQLPYIGSSCKVLRCSHRLHPRGASQRQGTTPVSLPPYIVPSVSAGKSLSLRVPHRTTLPPFAALLVAVSENQLASLLRACAAKVISVRVRWTSTVLTTGGEERRG